MDRYLRQQDQLTTQKYNGNIVLILMKGAKEFSVTVNPRSVSLLVSSKHFGLHTAQGLGSANSNSRHCSVGNIRASSFPVFFP